MAYFVFIFALSLDTFMAALSYNVSKIKVPMFSKLIICFVCMATIFFSFLLGKYLSLVIPAGVLKWFCFSVLFGIGFFKVIGNFVKKVIKDNCFKFSFCGIILEVYSDFSKADLDSSKNLSSLESVFLALVLSMDGLFSGIAFNISFLMILVLCVFCFLVNFFMFVLAEFIGVRASSFKFDFSLLSGFIFIFLAFLKLW